MARINVLQIYSFLSSAVLRFINYSVTLFTTFTVHLFRSYFSKLCISLLGLLSCVHVTPNTCFNINKISDVGGRLVTQEQRRTICKLRSVTLINYACCVRQITSSSRIAFHYHQTQFPNAKMVLCENRVRNSHSLKRK